MKVARRVGLPRRTFEGKLLKRESANADVSCERASPREQTSCARALVRESGRLVRGR